MSRRATLGVVVALAVLTLPRVVRAQRNPTPDATPQVPDATPEAPERGACDACARATAHLDALGAAGELLRAALPRLRRLADRRGMAGYEKLSTAELRALDQLAADRGRAALDDVAALACESTQASCVSAVRAVIACALDDLCDDAPGGPEDDADEDMLPGRVPREPDTCDPYTITVRGRRNGFGGELTTGWHDSAAPTEGRAWGFGVEARRLLTQRFDAVVRLDHARGRDAGLDLDGDGRDDVATGPIRRWSLLAGPTLVLASSMHQRVARRLELDLLIGGLLTTSQPGEDGLVAGADLGYRLSALRLGVRAIQGIVGASDTRMILAHVGVTVGATPSASYGGGCPGVGPPAARTTRWALGVDLPLSGHSAGTGLGYMAPGFAAEGAYHLHPRFDAIVRGDLLVFPNGDADRVLQQGLLAGGRLDLSRFRPRGARTGVFLAMLAGYGFASTTRPTTAGSGPVVDASIGWGGQGSDGASWLRLHGRFGLSGDNADLRAIFLSAGLELRIDRERWRDRL